MKRCLVLFAIFLCAGTVFASDIAANFAAANQLYAEGKFAEAAKAYNAILASGAVSPNLLFNDGNAQFKSGHLGRAIAAWRRAALLSPRDADALANLNFARNQTQGAPLHESRWSEWLGALTLNEWTALAAIVFWLAFILFAAMQLRPALKNILRGAARVVLVAAVFFCACLVAAAEIHFSQAVAVVVLPNAQARSGPFGDAQNAFAVHDGQELAVLDRRGEWVEVSDGVGRIGWMQDGQVEVLPEI